MTTDNVTLNQLRDANERRQAAWPGAEKVDLAFRGLELGGETGELANKLKKLIRIQRGIKGQSKEEVENQEEALLSDIAEELADVMICVDLIAMELGIDLNYNVPNKFNKTSVKNEINSFF